jgi:hypothetical protein
MRDYAEHLFEDYDSNALRSDERSGVETVISSSSNGAADPKSNRLEEEWNRPRRYGIGPTDRVVVDSDLTAEQRPDIYQALRASGARVTVLDPNLLAEEVASTIVRQNATVFVTTPQGWTATYPELKANPGEITRIGVVVFFQPDKMDSSYTCFTSVLLR